MGASRRRGRFAVPDEPDRRGLAAYIGEFVGTFALVFFITAVVSLYVTAPTPQQPAQPFIDFSVIGLVHVFALFFLIQTLGAISGAHFNPAVTVALTAIRAIRPPDAAIYIVMQLLGAVAGAFLTKALLLDEGNAVNYGATLVSDRLQGEAFPGMIVELIGTFFLVWAIVGVAVNPTAQKDWSGLVIAGTLGLVVMVLAPLTGAGFNPARSLGPALASGEYGNFLLTYVLGPLVGGVLAALTYTALFFQRGKKVSSGGEPVG